MTGTLIVSSSPIAVFSCNDCNPVTGQGGCDHMLEQLPPTSSIDTAYVPIVSILPIFTATQKYAS